MAASNCARQTDDLLSFSVPIRRAIHAASSYPSSVPVVLACAALAGAADGPRRAAGDARPPGHRHHHGVAITDPYRWLEDQNSPETRAWIDAQNAYTEKVLSQYGGRSALHAQIEKVMKIDSIGMPVRRGDRYFYLRRRADQNLDMLCVREKGRGNRAGGSNTLTPDGSISVVLQGGSDDGNLLAYGQRKGGADEITVTLSTSNAHPLSDNFPSARYGSLEITPDHKELLHSKYTPGVGPRAYRHWAPIPPRTRKSSATSTAPAITSAPTSRPMAATGVAGQPWLGRVKSPSSIFRT